MKKILLGLVTLFLLQQPLFAQDAVHRKDLSEQQKINFLNKVGYGVSFEEINEITKKNYFKWIDEKLNDKNIVVKKIENNNTFSARIDKDIDNFFKQYRDHDFNLVVAKNGGSTSEYVYGENGLINSELDKRIQYAHKSQNRINEMMVWFWFNHLYIGPRSNNISAIFLDDYENKIRLNALGKFKDLIKMSSTHPGMLYYLNNDLNKLYTFSDQNGYKIKRSEINENYAREFLELHTLGVNNGYTQKDVQELAKILSGHGIVFLSDYSEDLNLEKINKYSDFKKMIETQLSQNKYVLNKFYLYNGKFHDNSEKVFLGHKILGNQEKEMDEVIKIVTKKEESAKFISGKIAVFLMHDNPSKDLINKMSQAYLKNDTDIKEALRVLFYSDEFINSLNVPTKIKDPYVFTLGTFKTVFEKNPLEEKSARTNLINFLNLIEADPYFKITPDGFSVYGKSWLSSARLQEKIHFAIVNTLHYNKDKGYKINYPLLSKIANRKIENENQAISFLISDNWIKR